MRRQKTSFPRGHSEETKLKESPNQAHQERLILRRAKDSIHKGDPHHHGIPVQ